MAKIPFNGSSDPVTAFSLPGFLSPSVMAHSAPYRPAKGGHNTVVDTNYCHCSCLVRPVALVPLNAGRLAGSRHARRARLLSWPYIRRMLFLNFDLRKHCAHPKTSCAQLQPSPTSRGFIAQLFPPSKVIPDAVDGCRQSRPALLKGMEETCHLHHGFMHHVLDLVHRTRSSRNR